MSGNLACEHPAQQDAQFCKGNENAIRIMIEKTLGHEKRPAHFLSLGIA